MKSEPMFLAGVGMGVALTLIFGQPREKTRQRLNRVVAAAKRVRRGLRKLADQANEHQRREAAGLCKQV